MTNNQDYFIRFSVSRRVEHIAMFVTFIILTVTGLPQKFHNTIWAQEMTLLLGGIEFVRVIHRIAAFGMIFASIYHLVYGLNSLLVKREQFVMLPTFKDMKDVFDNIKYFVGLNKEGPQYERYNYMEKFDYWAVFWGMAIMAGSGLVLMFPALFTSVLPGVIVPIAKAAHSDEALLAILAIFLWHMYNVHFNPRIFPINTTIFTGKISKERMIEEHPLEYQRLVGDIDMSEVVEERIPRRKVALSGIIGVVVVGLIALLLAISFQTEVPEVEPIHANPSTSTNPSAGP